jgi:hypothetical protein
MKLTKDGAEALLPLIQKRIGGFRMKSYLDHEKDNARRAEENGCAYLTFKIEVKKDWKGGGSIYCPQMKCEISASNLATTIADLVQEFIDVEGGEQL